jgi:hypothetical protein
MSSAYATNFIGKGEVVQGRASRLLADSIERDTKLHLAGIRYVPFFSKPTPLIEMRAFLFERKISTVFY